MPCLAIFAQFLNSFGKGVKYTKFPYNTGGNRFAFTIDQFDNIYVVFLFQNRLEKYTREGELIFSISRDLPKDKQIDTDLNMYSTISTGIDVDSEGRLWLPSLKRDWTKAERNKRSDIEQTDLFELHVFDNNGVEIKRFQLTHFCDGIKIIDNKIYLWDKDRNMEIYIYEIR